MNMKQALNLIDKLHKQWDDLELTNEEFFVLMKSLVDQVDYVWEDDSI